MSFQNVIRFTSILFGSVVVTSLVGCGSDSGGGGSAQSQASLCASGCQRGAQACGSGFDEKACEQQCNASLPQGSGKIPDACKSQGDAYGQCAQNAKMSCPDGKTPMMEGCDAQMSALTQCIQANTSSAGGDAGTTGGDYDSDWGGWDDAF